MTEQDQVYEALKRRFAPIDDKWHTLATCVYSSIYWVSRMDKWTVVSVMTERLAPGAIITSDFEAAMHWFRDPENEALCIVRNGVVMVQRKVEVKHE